MLWLAACGMSCKSVCIFKQQKHTIFWGIFFLIFQDKLFVTISPSFQLHHKILLKERIKSACLNRRAFSSFWKDLKSNRNVFHYILGLFNCLIEGYPACNSVWLSSCRPFRDPTPAVTLLRDKNEDIQLCFTAPITESQNF